MKYAVTLNFLIQGISCGPPPHLTKSNYTVNGTEFGDELFYECEDGYILVGNHTSVCQADGTWTSSPKCQGLTTSMMRPPCYSIKFRAERQLRTLLRYIFKYSK